MQAPKSCNVSVLCSVLRAGTDVNAADADGRSALSIACMCLAATEQHRHIVELLLEHGARVRHDARVPSSDSSHTHSQLPTPHPHPNPAQCLCTSTRTPTRALRHRFRYYRRFIPITLLLYRSAASFGDACTTLSHEIRVREVQRKHSTTRSKFTTTVRAQHTSII